MGKIQKFQGIRGLAIICIIISHCLPVFNFAGALGVTMFMNLSGFLTVYNSKSRGEEYNFKWFIKKIMRFYPLYLVVTLLTATYFNAMIVYGVDSKTNINALLTNILMVQTYTSNAVYWGAFSQVGWYIPFVVLSIFVTPVFMRIWKRMNGEGACIVLVIRLYIDLFTILLSYGILDYEFVRWMIYVCPLYRLLDFFAGGCVAIMVRNTRITSWEDKKISKRALALLIGVLLLTITQIYLSIKIRSLSFYNVIWLVPVWIVLYLIGVLNNEWIKVFFENPVIVFIGNISMELFLCHLCVLHYCRNSFSGISPIVFYTLTFGTIILVSFVVHIISEFGYKVFRRRG